MPWFQQPGDGRKPGRAVQKERCKRNGGGRTPARTVKRPTYE